MLVGEKTMTNVIHLSLTTLQGSYYRATLQRRKRKLGGVKCPRSQSWDSNPELPRLPSLLLCGEERISECHVEI